MFRHIDFEKVDRVPYFARAEHRVDRSQNHSGNGDTIFQEKGNCYLYEKMGYHQTGHCTIIKDNMTIVDYEKD